MMQGRARMLMHAGLTVVAAAATLAHGQPSYRITEIELPAGATGSVATAINSEGMVAGYALDGENGRPFTWVDGALTLLPVPDGFPGATATGVSDVGIVCGSAWSRGSWGASNAVMWREGEVSTLPTFGGKHSACDGISPDGVITGWASTFDLFQGGRAFRYDGTLKNLGLLPWPIERVGSAGLAINAHNQVVGNTGFGPSAFLHDPVEGMIDLGMLGGLGIRAEAISHAGHIVGVSQTGARDAATAHGMVEHAFLWERGRMTDLGALPEFVQSRARGVNSSAVVVGHCLTHPAPGRPRRAFVWQDGEMFDLNDTIDPGSGWELRDARAINDAGHIVGEGLLHGERRAFLLTPTP